MTAYNIDRMWVCVCCGESTPIRLRDIELCPPCAANLLEARSRWLVRNPRVPRAPWPTADLRCERRPCVAARKLAVAAAAGEELALFDSPAEESV